SNNGICFSGGSDVPAGATTGPSADPSNKGKSPLLEEDPPVRERTFRQREEDRLGEEAARRMYEEEQDELEREREEMQKKRQQDVLNSAKYYTDSDWTDIMGQVHANQGLTADLLGPDVNEDNFAERMVALIAKRRRDFAAQRFQDKRNKPMTYAQQKAYMRTFVKNQSSTIYTTGWTMKHVKSFSDDQLKTEFDKIRAAVAELKSQNIRRSLKRPGADLEQASSKKSKSTEAPKSSVPDESQQPSVEVSSQKATIEDVDVPYNTASTAQHTASSLKKVGTRKKQLGRKGVHISHSTIPIEDGDPEAEHKMCIKYASDADSASDDDTPVNLYAVVDWELLPTGLGSINVFYRKDNSRKCFTSLREILHLVTRADLMTIYGRVMTFYQDKQAAGVGLVLWGDLKVLMDSPEVNDGSDVWKNQHTWSIQSWKLYSYTGVHVLETVSGLVVHMFVDKKYPLSVNLIERMLDHQLEICHGTVGNELTTAVQLIAFLKKQISDSRRPKVHDWVINSPCYHNIELASPEQTAIGGAKSVAGFKFSAVLQRCCLLLFKVSKDFLRFTLLLNDMNIYKMPLEQFQVNTKFLNTLPDEWSKFVTDVKLVKDLHTTNVDQLHAYPQQHERHANEDRLMYEPSTLTDRTLELRATIDTLEYTITEASVRSKLQLAYASEISLLPNTEIFEGIGNMGIYKFSKLIFDGIVANLKSKTKFLMYPRFPQMILEIQTEGKHPYLAIVLTKKIFGNMKRGFRGVPRPLLPAMLPVVAVDQSTGQADQAVTQPSPSEPLPSSSPPLVISATTESEPTPAAEQTTHPNLLSPEPIEHTFEQPSPEHQPLLPRQETEIP
ncbi:hypothetical protein Tco_0167837, partial [Tanacetum coccineum]